MLSFKSFGQRAFEFYDSLEMPSNLPEHVGVFSPLGNEFARESARKFYNKFFNDSKKRVYVLGINPGRFGSGVTGINFTDPVALEKYCGIENNFQKRRELSSEFVYTFIEKWGGAKKFYSDFFLTALCPVGFTYKGLNYNFYDSKEVLRIAEPYIISTFQKQYAIGAKPDAVLFGTGKNQKFFDRINSEYGFFKSVYPLEHPRYIMQYKRRSVNEYLEKYYKIFSDAL